MCLGNGGQYRRLTWERYGSPRAVFRGQALANDRTPNCAEGHSHWVRARDFVWRIRWTCGKRVYTRLGALHYPFRLWAPGYDHCP
jgi:hypothetical protein